MVEKALADVNHQDLCNRSFSPSPATWEDQALYFLLLDRFSDGNEIGYADNEGNRAESGTTPLYRPEDDGNAITTPDDAARWRDAGGRWVGGTLRGLASKIGYLRRMGVTALCVSPIFKQVAFQPTYHGYGIQNYLDVDPHFGSREDLRDMVNLAHENGIYVILDIILNHSGNVFGYDANRYPAQDDHGNWYMDPRWDGQPYAVAGFREKEGNPTIPFASGGPAGWPDGAIWPVEFQQPQTFTQKGRISSWDYYPEYLDGDFFDLKDVHHGQGPLDDYQPSPALRAVCQVYKFWIAYADIDGFRVDTVKHMDLGATRFFTSVIHEFAQSIGKENFYLIGEITGGRTRAYETLEETGLNAALGIDDTPLKIEGLVKGVINPSEYFDLFRNSMLVRKDSHVWFRDKIVTTFDDHDNVRQGSHKHRFCAGDPAWSQLVLNVMALNATTLGIPCMYYGTEQRFDGQGDSDRYIREAMFGDDFGAFRSRNRHFFDEDSYEYKETAKILEIRRQRIALRRGRQYLRQVSGDGQNFDLPHIIGDKMRSIVPWSRIFDDKEMLLAVNTDESNPSSTWVTIDDHLHQGGDVLTCIYSTDAQQISRTVTVQSKNGKSVYLTAPPAGFMIYE